MPPPWLHFPSFLALPEHCEPISPLLTNLSSALHICLPTPLALLSSTLGTLSIVSWLFAQLPQIYKNYAIQSTVGLSSWFLVEWCLGDSANLIGAVLTNQAGWQVTVAAYYVFVDVVLVFQYYWYTHLKPRALARYASNDDASSYREGRDGWEDLSSPQIVPFRPSPSTPPIPTLEPKEVPGRRVSQLASIPPSSSSSLRNEKRNSPGRVSTTASPSGGSTPFASPGAVLLVTMACAVTANAMSSDASFQNQPVHESTREFVGRISSWVSTVMYLASRIPQLYKNYRRRSTAGLSPLLFSAAFCGNLFYSTSLVANPNAWFNYPPHGGGGWAGPEGSNRLEWIGRAIPFFLGAAGVLALDGAMGVQFLIYAQKSSEIEIAVPVKERSRGRRKWKKVTGWMKGWIPSVSPDRVSSGEQAAPLLAHSHNRYGGV